MDDIKWKNIIINFSGFVSDFFFHYFTQLFE